MHQYGTMMHTLQDDVLHHRHPMFRGMPNAVQAVWRRRIVSGETSKFPAAWEWPPQRDISGEAGGRT